LFGVIVIYLYFVMLGYADGALFLVLSCGCICLVGYLFALPSLFFFFCYIELVVSVVLFILIHNMNVKLRRSYHYIFHHLLLLLLSLVNWVLF
jgi:hypothetical protein